MYFAVGAPRVLSERLAERDGAFSPPSSATAATAAANRLSSSSSSSSLSDDDYANPRSQPAVPPAVPNDADADAAAGDGPAAADLLLPTVQTIASTRSTSFQDAAETLAALASPAASGAERRKDLQPGSHGQQQQHQHQQNQQHQPTILAIRKCPHAQLFASITYNTVHLWSIRPDVLLSKVVRTQETLDEDGENADLIWKPDGTQLVVLTNEGFMHFYDIIELDNKLFECYFRSTHHMAPGPGENKAFMNRVLRFRMALEIDSGTQCGIGLAEEILICTNSPPSILSLFWSGEVNIAGTIPLTDFDFIVDPKDCKSLPPCHAITQIVLHDERYGRAYVAQRTVSDQQMSADMEAPGQDQWTGHCFYNESGDDVPATTISFNPTFTLVAVGNLQGVVHVFDLPDDVHQVVHSHNMAISKPGDAKAPIRLSAATALSWTHDGYALAVAWIYGGMSVWSVYGSLLMSTVSEDTFVHSSDGIVDNTNELFFTGTQDWVEVIVDIYVLQFAKASILTCDSWSNSRHVCLLQDDRLLLYEGLYTDVDATSLDPMNWETIQIPSVYLAENWPIRYVSINSAGHFIAVAGTRGLAHYNTLSGKWKLFGNEHQEQSFVVRGMLWFRSMLIVACQDVVSHASEIRVFSRETKLDHANLLHIERLPHPVLVMNNTDSHLLLYCADHVVRYYSIHVSASGHRLQLRPQQAFSMQDVVGGWGGTVQAVARFPPPGEISIETMIHNPFVVLRNGSLHMISKRGDAWEALQIATHTEHFWISAHEDEIEEFSNTMWAFNGASVKILTNIIVDPVEGVDSSFLDAALNISVDYYPLTVLIQKGLLVGIEKRLSLSTSLDISQFGTDAKSHLFLQYIIRHLLILGFEQKAFVFSSNYQSLEYFSHALEVLLHTVLEEEADKKVEATSESLLTRTVRFVQRFPRHLEIIGNCARKSEMALWKYFFAVVGDPKAMFQRSLDEGLLGTATSYLIIIQTLETSAVSSQLAVLLLQKSFEMRDYNMGSELARFLRNIDEGENMHEAEMQALGQDVPRSDQLDKSSEGLDIAYFDSLINDHAKVVLLDQRFRDLGYYATLFQINLGEWLEREQYVSKPLWTVPVRRRSVHSSAFESGAGMGGGSSANLDDSEPNVPGMPRKGRRPSARGAPRRPANRREEEIRNLLKATLRGHFPALAILLGAMLLDHHAILDVLETEAATPMFPSLKDALMKTKARGYRQLAKHLEHALALSVTHVP
ncbi:RIC1-domain-containing protein [Entophlyctis helioformis]|nr:RIC1-domain-containing protein [Entophlyctis helioformis]